MKSLFAFLLFPCVSVPFRVLRGQRSRPGLAGALAFLALMAATAAGAQTKKPASKAPAKPAKASPPIPAGPSTQDGVYTDEQAKRGRYVYSASCRSCHAPQTHTGATFAQWWRNKPLADLFTFIATKMPKNDPGSLAPEETADVVAYLLKMNAMPTGPDELYPDADSLKKFRIETKKRATGSSTATRAKP